MKRSLFLIIAVVAISFSAFAQKPSGTNPFSIDGGLTINALTGQTFTAPSLNVRYFVNDEISGRLGIMVNSQSNVDMVYGFNDDGFQVETKKGTLETKSMTTQIRIGGAYHFAQTERLSPYVAVDLALVSGSNSEVWEYTDQNLTAYDENTKGEQTQKFSGFGAMLSLGADYYFAENIFIGLEIGFGLNSQSDKTGTWTQTVGQTATTDDVFPQNTNSNLGNMSSQFVRIGWRF
jgi:outer membrane protein W